MQRMNTDTNSGQTLHICKIKAILLSTMMSTKRSTRKKKDTLNKSKRSSKTTG